METFDVEPKPSVHASQKYKSNKRAADATSDAIGRETRALDHWKILYARGKNARQTIFMLLDEPESSILATVISTAILALIFISSTTFVMETHPDVRNDPDTVQLFHNIETGCILSFTIEYVVRVATCSQRPRKDTRILKYMRNPMCIVDLLSITPFYIELMLSAINSDADVSKLAVVRMLRMSRVFRVMKLGSHAEDLQLFVEGFKRSGEGLAVLTFLLVLYLCVGGSVLYMLEYDAQRADERDGFTSIPATWYFIIASMTTVGYGDQYPITSEGRLVCGICMLCGIFVLGLPIVIIGHSFEEVFAQEDELKAKRRAMMIEKRSHNRAPDTSSSQASAQPESTDAMQNPLALNRDNEAIEVSHEKTIATQMELDRSSNVNEFDKQTALLNLCELLDDLYDQTQDNRFHKAALELSKESTDPFD